MRSVFLTISAACSPSWPRCPGQRRTAELTFNLRQRPALILPGVYRQLIRIHHPFRPGLLTSLNYTIGNGVVCRSAGHRCHIFRRTRQPRHTRRKRYSTRQEPGHLSSLASTLLALAATTATFRP